MVAEIELSKEEDNPTCLAVGSGHLIFAGLNSSPCEIRAGRNLHFRIYEIREVSNGDEKETRVESSRLKITEGLKCSLFSNIEKDIYQRLIKLTAPHQDQPQLGAITTGLAKNHEIVLFKTAHHNPPKTQEILKIDNEAVDIDFFQISPDEFLFAYCDEHAVYVKKIAAVRENLKPKCIYLVPTLQSDQRYKNFSIRAIRWLTKYHIIILINLFRNGGVKLHIIEVPPEGIQTQVLKSTHLPRRHKKATGLCIANLSIAQDLRYTQTDTQFVLAIACQDGSILLFTINLKTEAAICRLSEIIPFCSLKNVHPLQITNLAFSTVIPPNLIGNNILTQPVLRLASVAISQTVIVHTLPLFPIYSSIGRDEFKTNHYVVRLPHSTNKKKIFAAISIIGVLLMAILIQLTSGIKSDTPRQFVRKNVPSQLQKILGIKFPTRNIQNVKYEKMDAEMAVPVEVVTDDNQGSHSNFAAGIKT